MAFFPGQMIGLTPDGRVVGMTPGGYVVDVQQRAPSAGAHMHSAVYQQQPHLAVVNGAPVIVQRTVRVNYDTRPSPSASYQAGYHDGRHDGYHEGHHDGYHEGRHDGFHAGQQNGFQIGHNVGYSEGHRDGYFAGRSGQSPADFMNQRMGLRDMGSRNGVNDSVIVGNRRYIISERRYVPL
jgi:hypothetical protein